MSERTGPQIAASGTERALLEELAVHLKWASRANSGSTSRKELRRLINEPRVLDLLEALVAERLEADRGK